MNNPSDRAQDSAPVGAMIMRALVDEIQSQQQQARQCNGGTNSGAKDVPSALDLGNINNLYGSGCPGRPGNSGITQIDNLPRGNGQGLNVERTFRANDPNADIYITPKGQVEVNQARLQADLDAGKRITVDEEYCPITHTMGAQQSRDLALLTQHFGGAQSTKDCPNSSGSGATSVDKLPSGNGQGLIVEQTFRANDPNADIYITPKGQIQINQARLQADLAAGKAVTVDEEYCPITHTIGAQQQRDLAALTKTYGAIKTSTDESRDSASDYNAGATTDGADSGNLLPSLEQILQQCFQPSQSNTDAWTALKTSLTPSALNKQQPIMG